MRLVVESTSSFIQLARAGVVQRKPNGSGTAGIRGTSASCPLRRVRVGQWYFSQEVVDIPEMTQLQIGGSFAPGGPTTR